MPPFSEHRGCLGIAVLSSSRACPWSCSGAQPMGKPGEIFFSMGFLSSCHLPSLGLPGTTAMLESLLGVKSSLVLAVLPWDPAAAPQAWCHPCCHSPGPSCHRRYPLIALM